MAKLDGIMKLGIPVIRELEINKIRRDGGTQPRAERNEEAIQDYAADMKAKAKFPAIVVFFDGEHYWLADGFHRVEAAEQIRRKVILAKIYQGDLRAAKLYSYAEANERQGMRKSRADKRNAVIALLKDEEWGTWSDRTIAELVGVHHSTVGSIRADLVSTGGIRQLDERKSSRAGIEQTMRTAGISESNTQRAAAPDLEYTDVPDDPSLAPWDRHASDIGESTGQIVQLNNPRGAGLLSEAEIEAGLNMSFDMFYLTMTQKYPGKHIFVYSDVNPRHWVALHGQDVAKRLHVKGAPISFEVRPGAVVQYQSAVKLRVEDDDQARELERMIGPLERYSDNSPDFIRLTSQIRDLTPWRSAVPEAPRMGPVVTDPPGNPLRSSVLGDDAVAVAWTPVVTEGGALALLPTEDDHSVTAPHEDLSTPVHPQAHLIGPMRADQTFREWYTGEVLKLCAAFDALHHEALRRARTPDDRDLEAASNRHVVFRVGPVEDLFLGLPDRPNKVRELAEGVHHATAESELKTLIGKMERMKTGIVYFDKPILDIQATAEIKLHALSGGDHESEAA